MDRRGLEPRERGIKMTFTKGCIPIKKELERRQKISRTMSGTRPNNFNLFKERCLEYMKINHGNSKTFKEGPSHPNFQENPSYRAIHAWARERMPKEKICKFCKVREKIELSNISGDYKREMNDWQWLCAKCHRAFDKGKNNIRKKYGRLYY